MEPTTAQIIPFRKPVKSGTCNFCLTRYQNFKGLMSSTGKNICKDCGKEALKRIKEADAS